MVREWRDAVHTEGGAFGTVFICGGTTWVSIDRDETSAAVSLGPFPTIYLDSLIGYMERAANWCRQNGIPTRPPFPGKQPSRPAPDVPAAEDEG